MLTIYEANTKAILIIKSSKELVKTSINYRIY